MSSDADRCCDQAFCVFASVGVLAIYCYMLTFFCACLSIDEKRQAANRRDCCPCIVLEDEQPAGARSVKLRAFISDVYAPWLMQTPVRIAVLVVFFLWFFVALWMCTDVK